MSIISRTGYAKVLEEDDGGNMLGGNTADTSGSTSLLYAGEMFDVSSKRY